MKKQDRTYSRTPEDLERKYNLGKLSQGGNSKEIEELRNEVSKLNESLGDIRFGIDKNGSCGFFNSDNKFTPFRVQTKMQTISTTMNGSITPWSFVFDELTEVEQVTLSYSFQGYSFNYDSKTDDCFIISGNRVEFPHGTDTADWNITCTAIGY